MTKAGWPAGPANLTELYAWSEYNSSVLLENAESIETIKALADHDILLNDAYSGAGTASWTLHLQHHELMRNSFELRICIYIQYNI